jgi:hypothetical protein
MPPAAGDTSVENRLGNTAPNGELPVTLPSQSANDDSPQCILTSWNSESGSRLEDGLNRGVVFVISSVASALGLVIGWLLGFPCWVVQQLFILALALNLMPSLNGLPGIQSLLHGFRSLREFYRCNPRLRMDVAVIARSVPFLGWAVMIQELRVMATVMLVELPLGFIVHALTTFVWHFHGWGVASEMGFWESIAVQALMTFIYAPYLVLFVLALTWNVRREPLQSESVRPETIQTRGQQRKGQRKEKAGE